MTVPSFPGVIETDDVALTSYFLRPTSEPQFTVIGEVHESITDLKVRKLSGPYGISNGALQHLPKRAVSILVRIFNAVLRTHHFPQMWKHARGISILKPGKNRTLPSSYRPISLLETIGKLFEKTLLARIVHVLDESGMLRYLKFGCRLRDRTSLQLARLVERISMNFRKRGSPAQFSST